MIAVKSSFANRGPSLIAIRSDDMERAARFYAAIGVRLVKHSHPPCGEHYASDSGGCVFEIYPRKPHQQPTASTVIGFRVSCIDQAVDGAVSNGGTLKRARAHSEWGEFAIVTDPDGHDVHLTGAAEAD